MSGRGRKSAAELAVTVTRLPNARLEPPAELTDEQSAEWLRIVGGMPADWFTTATQDTLIQLCRHIVQARKLDAKLAKGGLDPKTEIDLSREQREESRTITTLYRAMRMTQQSRYDAKKKSTTATQRKPWEQTA